MALKATVFADGAEQELTDSFNQEECRTLRGSEAQEENLRSLPNKEGETDSKGWS